MHLLLSSASALCAKLFSNHTLALLYHLLEYECELGLLHSQDYSDASLSHVQA